MIPGVIKGATRRLAPPKGMTKEECSELAIVMAYSHEPPAGIQMSSAWYPNQEEIDAIVKGHPVILTVWGNMHPPVMVAVSSEPMPEGHPDKQEV